MGDEYLLPSIAVVVVGGTLITGGRGDYLGMLGGVLLLTALQTLLAGTTLPYATRAILFGLVILSAVVACARNTEERKAHGDSQEARAEPRFDRRPARGRDGRRLGDRTGHRRSAAAERRAGRDLRRLRRNSLDGFRKAHPQATALEPTSRSKATSIGCSRRPRTISAASMP